MPLAKDDRARYARQLALPEIGEAGQERLLNSSALIIGAGGLGSPAAFYIAAAGVGRLGVVDSDVVDLSNLQRQILHGSHDLGRKKALSAIETLGDLNPSLKLDAFDLRLDESNAPELFAKYDFIVDATDTFASKVLIGEAAWRAGKPHSHAGIAAFAGQALTVLPPHGPCVKCLYRETPKDPAAPRGPLGAVPGVIGAVQAIEAIKFLAGLKPSLTGAALFFDALSVSFRKVPLKPNLKCPLCGGRA
jgi:molybdopterin/thiamine biosynthesis adenylyltransferase